MQTNRAQRRQLERDNAKFPTVLSRIPESEWPVGGRGAQIEVWRSRDYLVQVFQDGPGVIRLSVCRTMMRGERFADEISWDDLQRLKRECGRGDLSAVEFYPADQDVVNVANMRHLWIFDSGPQPPWGRLKA